MLNRLYSITSYIVMFNLYIFCVQITKNVLNC